MSAASKGAPTRTKIPATDSGKVTNGPAPNLARHKIRPRQSRPLQSTRPDVSFALHTGDGANNEDAEGAGRRGGESRALLTNALVDAPSCISWMTLLVGAIIGFLGSRATAWRDRQIHLKKIARNLIQETRRIRDELGKRPGTIVFLGGQDAFAVPSIHPWMQTLVPEAALIHGDIVGDFMRLDRELHNLAIVRGWYQEAVKLCDVMPATYGAKSEKYRDAKNEAAEKRVEFEEANARVIALLAGIDQHLKSHSRV